MLQRLIVAGEITGGVDQRLEQQVAPVRRCRERLTQSRARYVLAESQWGGTAARTSLAAWLAHVVADRMRSPRMLGHAWVPVTAERAAAHPLFGLRGWLRLVSLLTALTAIAGPPITLVYAVKVAALPPALLPAGLVVVALLVLGSALWIVGAVLWFRLAPNFLAAWVELGVLAIALDVAGDLLLRAWGPLPPGFVDEGGSMLAEVAINLACTAVPYLLFWRSRRFRVTFRHELRDDDPLLPR
jgi:hypothetical protein